ncbi:hypothetical protein FBU31_003176 [Coemansia sp. 'formosensis']|nr:hypothetical protein FBU31_003176 [Coemansia sp. 'formosensis']
MAEDDVQQQQQRAMLDDDMVAVQSWMWRHLRHNDQLLVNDFEDDDDDVLPLYGESDNDGEYSDSLLHEISEEQRVTSEQQARLNTVEREHIAEVQWIMQQQLVAFSGEWQAKQQPRLELHTSSLWRSNVANCIHLEMLLVKLVNECLPKIQCAVIDSGEACRSKIVSRCESLHVTADQISEIKWLLELTSGPRPLLLQSRHMRRLNAEQDLDRVTGRNTRKHNQPQKRIAQRYYNTEASSTLPGLSSHHNRSDRHACPTRGSSDVNDNNISNDSMDDLIDDDNDDKVVPVGSVDSDSFTTSNRCLVSLVPSVDASTFAAELAHHSPDAMYLAAIDCIQQMAQGVTSFGMAPPCGTDAVPKDMVPAVIALRVWSEFQCWIHSARPMVKVQYANFHSCDKAKRQLDHLLAKQQASSNMEISIRLLQQWVPK